MSLLGAATGCAGNAGDTPTLERASDVIEVAPEPVSIAAGHVHSCALMSDTTVRCWGRGEFGSLGDGAMINTPVPAVVSGLSGVTELSSNGNHTCALLGDGTIRCWGVNYAGQLGDGTTADGPLPVAVIGVDDAVQISVGYDHTCARRSGGSVWCWGTMINPEFEDWGSPPAEVPGFAGAVALGSGYGRTCALMPDATVKCFFVGEEAPATVPDLSDVVSVSVGGSGYCAIESSGDVYCAGNNEYGQLGRAPSELASSTVPLRVPDLFTPATRVEVGFFHSCAVVGQGGVRCWGYGSSLGIGPAGATATPTRVSRLINAQSLDVGLFHTCVTSLDHTGVCWGDNSYGQSGNPAHGVYPRPVRVMGL